MPFVPSRLYGLVRSRQLEGTYPGAPGTGEWVTTANRVSRGYGMVEEGAWKQATAWPPVEPAGLDDLAKKIGPSPVRWASYLASPASANDAGAQLPPSPACPRPANTLSLKTFPFSVG